MTKHISISANRLRRLPKKPTLSQELSTIQFLSLSEGLSDAVLQQTAPHMRLLQPLTGLTPVQLILFAHVFRSCWTADYLTAEALYDGLNISPQEALRYAPDIDALKQKGYLRRALCLEEAYYIPRETHVALAIVEALLKRFPYLYKADTQAETGPLLTEYIQRTKQKLEEHL